MTEFALLFVLKNGTSRKKKKVSPCRESIRRFRINPRNALQSHNDLLDSRLFGFPVIFFLWAAHLPSFKLRHNTRSPPTTKNKTSVINQLRSHVLYIVHHTTPSGATWMAYTKKQSGLVLARTSTTVGKEHSTSI